MDVELLVVPGCPNEALAHGLVSAVLAELGIDATVVTTVITTDEQAQSAEFNGSPTFLIDGRDPFAASGAAVGLACRVYSTPAGLAGTPSQTKLRTVMERAAAAD